MTAREFLTEYNKSNEWGVDDASLAETLIESGSADGRE